MEGGRDWWQQITEALDQVEFMVLVMTPAAMQSPMVRKEWPKFVNDLNTRCEQVRVPFMVEDLPLDFVPRSQEFDELIGKLLDEQREEPKAITAALRGAGGYGKTTMAKALCHDERIQQAFDDGILWVTLGENPGNLVGKIVDLIETLSYERPGFTGIDAATARLAELLTDRDILLVIDDAWNAAHLKPFIQGANAALASSRRATRRCFPSLRRVSRSMPCVRMKPCNCSLPDSMISSSRLLIGRSWARSPVDWANGHSCSSWPMACSASAPAEDNRFPMPWRT
jgi:hypothetical protein